MITLAQAIALRPELKKKIKELEGELNRAAEIRYSKMEKGTEPPRAAESYWEEIERIRADLVALDLAIARANLEFTVPWVSGDEERHISLTEALLLARDLRAQAATVQGLALRDPRPQRVDPRFGASTEPEYTRPSYDVAAMRRLYESMERRARRLSALIEATNHTAQVRFDASRYMEG